MAELNPRTARWTQAYLATFYGRRLLLRSISAQTNRSNGYTVYYYTWDYVGPEVEEASDPLPMAFTGTTERLEAADGA